MPLTQKVWKCKMLGRGGAESASPPIQSSAIKLTQSLEVFLKSQVQGHGFLRVFKLTERIFGLILFMIMWEN